MERWAYIPGYEAKYEVSSLGRVRSYVRGGQRVLKPGRMPSGHVSVCLGRGNSRCVHELVLTTFVGPKPPAAEARHLNGVPDDNRLNNLEWASRSRNTQDKKWHTGARTYVLTPKDVKCVRRMRREGSSVDNIATQFGVCKTTIYNVLKRRTHIDVQ